MPLTTFHDRRYQWSQAKSLMPPQAQCERGPQGALVPDSDEEMDHIAVVYDKGETPPKITIKQVSGSVHQVFADGIAVAIVARASGDAPNPSDVLLVERGVHS
ncbi:hypothetical protein [Sulfitobacter guttiformis]|uniref:Uncharacterized protein n=1 Tax=Sulfitobacter guttiformis TaxID=74349 RepID=A0A420DMZ6_9RHOB|nr:hypothetical protein [Sulfitobacter guttiformis]KIN72923.1 hypothetical protein Z949_2105 [Sulfitobacter guttiformis KCTC 32187]RKE95612.1 hypothetical protein C8N30_0149 [Sulfitobacter guttiformis]